MPALLYVLFLRCGGQGALVAINAGANVLFWVDVLERHRVLGHYNSLVACCDDVVHEACNLDLVRSRADLPDDVEWGHGLDQQTTFRVGVRFLLFQLLHLAQGLLDHGVDHLRGLVRRELEEEHRSCLAKRLSNKGVQLE